MIKNKAKITFVDIETTNLAANYGYILCVSWKFAGYKKVHTVSIVDSPTFKKDPTNDKWVVRRACEEISKADMWVTWYGLRFDIPYLQSRLLAHRLKPMPPIPHVDAWRIARYKLKLNSNRLASVTAFLGLENKTPLNGPIWIKAMAGHKPSIRYVVKHCEQDVRVLEQVYDQIKSLSTTHPNINLVAGKGDACPTCGDKRIVKRGFSIARTVRSQRYQCQSCGSWCSGPAEKREGEKAITIR